MTTRISLSADEILAAIHAIGQMTDGNANDFDEWSKQTSGTRDEWAALLRAERKLYAAYRRTNNPEPI